jgi:MFS family permease
MYKKTVRQYYLLSFLASAGGMQIISAVYVTFLMNNGLNLFQVNLVNAVFFLTLFICEIPTGAFADIFGRKSSYVMSAVLVSLSMFVYGSSHTFTEFVCAEIIAAFGMTFRTGAFQAWLVDSLRHHGYDSAFNKIFGRASLYNQIGGGIGAIVGAYLAVRNSALPWFVGSVGMALVATLAYFTMREEYFVRGTFSWKMGLKSMRDTAVSSIRYGSKDKAVRFILIITFVQIYAVQAFNMYWQPFFRDLGVLNKHLGFVFTGMMFFIALGALIASRMNVEGRERKVILASMMFVGVTVALASISSVLPIALTLFFLHESGRGFWTPMADSYLHQRIPSHERATITSFCGMAPHIGGAMGLAISGVIAQVFGITVAWIVGGTVLVGGAFALRKNGNGT